MPALPVSLTFAEFTDPEVLFASIEAANAFFQEITITIAYTNLPEATTTQRGAVKKAAAVAYAASVVNLTYNTVENDEGSIEVPDTATMVAMKAKLDALETAFVALKAAMIAADQLTA